MLVGGKFNVVGEVIKFPILKTQGRFTMEIHTFADIIQVSKRPQVHVLKKRVRFKKLKGLNTSNCPCTPSLAINWISFEDREGVQENFRTVITW